MKSLGGFTVGDRVRLHPGTDFSVRGARYGTVVKVGTKYLRVHLDVDEGRARTFGFTPDLLARVVDW